MKFDKDSGFEVEENKLGVVYVGRPQRKSLVQASVFPDEVSFYFIGLKCFTYNTV
jgi:hypothetical protein